jgi:hypothetical protein
MEKMASVVHSATPICLILLIKEFDRKVKVYYYLYFGLLVLLVFLGRKFYQFNI